MYEAEFDQFADEYRATHAQNIRASGEGPEYFAAYKIADVAKVWTQLNPQGNSPPSILDFGGGTGNSVPFFRQYFPHSDLTCLDVSRKSLAIAQERFPSQANYRNFAGETIPFPDQSLDIAFAACVFHHIPGDLHHLLLKELWRVLKPGGCLFIFEHNPWNPLTVQAVNTCPFDENAVLITGPKLRDRFRRAGFNRPQLRYRIFFPKPLAVLRSLEPYLTWLPLGAQYYPLGTKQALKRHH